MALREGIVSETFLDGVIKCADCGSRGYRWCDVIYDKRQAIAKQCRSCHHLHAIDDSPQLNEVWEKCGKLSAHWSRGDSVSDTDKNYDNHRTSENRSQYLSTSKNGRLINLLKDNNTQCPNCGSSDTERYHELEIGGDVYLECQHCDTLIGFDDSFTNDDLLKVIPYLPVDICPCGNDDPNQYTVLHDHLRCMKCKSQMTWDDARKKLSPDSKVSSDGEIVVCQQCGNTNQERIHVHYRKLSGKGVKVLGFECLSCKNETTAENKTEKEHISHARKLQQGDHVAFWRSLGYYHHALVLEVDPVSNRFCVAHYAPVDNESGKFLGEISSKQNTVVHTKWIYVAREKDQLYRYNYSCVYNAGQSIARALGRLGEESYNLVTRNCEHFVRWCKDGVEKSGQVMTVLKAMKELGVNTFTKLSHACAGFALKELLATELTAEVTEAAFTMFPKCMFEVLGALAMAAIEGYGFYKTYKKSKGKLDREEITKEHHRETLITDGSTRVGRLLGAVGGGLGGEFVGACIGTCFGGPVVGGILGALIGVVVGSLLGQAIGACAGNQIAQRYSRKTGIGDNSTK